MLDLMIVKMPSAPAVNSIKHAGDKIACYMVNLTANEETATSLYEQEKGPIKLTHLVCI